MFPKIGVPQMDKPFIMENPIKMDDLGVFPIFLETPIWPSIWKSDNFNQKQRGQGSACCPATVVLLMEEEIPFPTTWDVQNLNWLVLSDEQMSKRWPFSLLNAEQMSNWLGVRHLPVINNGITYQPQLVSLPDFWTINSMFKDIGDMTKDGCVSCITSSPMIRWKDWSVRSPQEKTPDS